MRFRCELFARLPAAIRPQRPATALLPLPIAGEAAFGARAIGAYGIIAGTMNPNYAENAWPDIQRAAEEDYIVVVPLGCTEQHGPHLPLDCDTGAPLEAIELARERHGVKALSLPPLPFGPAWEHMSFPGTISLTYETWLRVVREVVASLLRHGFRRILVWPGCGGHFGIESTLYQLWSEARRGGRDVVIEVRDPGPSARVQSAIAELFPDIGELHAGEVETSIQLATRPRLVQRDRVAKPEIKERPRDGRWWARMEEISESGATGDPTRATEEAGRRLIELMTEDAAEYLREFDAASQMRTTPEGGQS
jgi:creatinine amidohydrolase